MQIEQLEQENRHLKAEGEDASATSSPADEALLRLQAENATLLKKVRGLFLGTALRTEDKGLVFKRGHLIEMYWGTKSTAVEIRIMIVGTKKLRCLVSKSF